MHLHLILNLLKTTFHTLYLQSKVTDRTSVDFVVTSSRTRKSSPGTEPYSHSQIPMLFGAAHPNCAYALIVHYLPPNEVSTLVTTGPWQQRGITLTQTLLALVLHGYQPPTALTVLGWPRSPLRVYSALLHSASVL